MKELAFFRWSQMNFQSCGVPLLLLTMSAEYDNPRLEK